ncbi:HET domain protein [Aspergillus taichungensis]|uniref:HET domain protein n=1 Tax=Aspergillus taichungensis TaxID=482145 RepID=A0A2J5I7A8_9EURO|nr:HET domain protein [Aspergillus taichungensis]
MAVVQDRDKSCAACLKIPPISEIAPGHGGVNIFWDSYQQLEESAAKGCPSCIFFYRDCIKPDAKRATSKYLSASKSRGPYGLGWNGHLPWEQTPLGERPKIDLLYDIDLPPEAWEDKVYSIGSEASFEVFADPEEPISKYILARDVMPDPRADGAFELVKGWVDSCCQFHSSCKRDEDPVLPRFIIEISAATGTAEFQPSLRLVENDGSQRSPYITLSFIWGVRVQPVQLMRENRKQFLESIPYDRLPNTVRDAVFVAHKLNVKYLWVDTLCIVQDDDEVKREQIAQMCDIYGHSYLTVQAANVNSVHESFLRPRAPPEHPFLKLRFDDASHIYLRPGGYEQTETAFSPVDRRGWIFEEGVLPPRLLVYRAEQMVLACRTAYKAENGYRAAKRPGPYPSFLDPAPWWRNSRVKGPQRRSDKRWDFLNCWYSALDFSYTGRALTVASDKLPAIHGVAVRLGDQIGGRYVAGLWESDLPWGLLWASRGHWTGPEWLREQQRASRPEKYRAPSWSWAAIDGATYHLFSDRVYSRPVATVDTSALRLDTLGDISDGVMKIRGPLFLADLVPPDLATVHHDRPRSALSTFAWSNANHGSGPPPGTELGKANFDIPGSHEAEVWCLHLVSSRGLILECVNQEKRTFRRVGIFTFQEDQLNAVPGNDFMADVILI